MSFVSRWKQTIRDETYFPSKRRAEAAASVVAEEPPAVAQDEKSASGPGAVEETQTSGGSTGLNKYWTIITAGAGLFSDGYVNNSIGAVNTCLSILYPKEYANSLAISNVSSIAFVGTVVGQLGFGYVADYHSRKIGMIASTVILILFTILCSGAWGAGGSIYGMLAALTAYRFFIGIGIGGEYPAGSVACAEATNALSKGHRNRWFVLFTNFMIDSGFVVAAFVPLVLLWICGSNHLTPVWRVTLGLGAIPPMSLFWLRLKFRENDQFKNNNLKRARLPYWLILRFYAPRLVVVSIIWFIYDFSAYSFGIYSSTIINVIIPDGDLYKTFGWNVVMNLFYIPGSFLGAFAADYLGPRLCVAIGIGLQGIIGFIMAACYDSLKQHVAGFVVVYGIFMTLGEFGAGDNIGLIASKTSASAIRGQYYGIAAAIGKIGAFVGTYIFPIIIRNAGGAHTTKGNQAPFWVSSSLCIFSATIALFLLPPLTQDAVSNEDVRFREYLSKQGFDLSLFGDLDVIEGSSATEEVAVDDESAKHNRRQDSE
ncbi:glycerophosphoinositol transporter 1 [Trichomonascus vanleenenianus]|uniref:glycerophosphoinositol transporter 1 n=1 Tax=Trichomonascus vanleenenianus TaxID=2268995 RepID=UPI003ECACD38